MKEIEDFRNLDWDDAELIRAYNKGMKIKTKKESKSSKDKKTSLIKKWKVGGNCCAKFSGDGLYYEAKIVSLNGDFCTVEFWGYNDTEDVALKDLEESAGKRARKKQIKESAVCAMANLPSSEEEVGSHWESDVESSVYGHAAKGGAKSRKGNRTVEKNELNYFAQEMYPAPAPVPITGPMFQQAPAPYYVAPPAPTNMPLMPPLPEECSDIAPLLISWYWAGYYSGSYAAREQRVGAQGPRIHNCCPRAHHCSCHF